MNLKLVNVFSPIIRQTLNWSCLPLILLLICLRTVHAFDPGYQTRGQVIDADGKQPIAGVWIVQAWRGGTFCIPVPGPHGFCHQTPCIASAVAQSDAMGRFDFPAPARFAGGPYVNVEPGFGAFAIDYRLDHVRTGPGNLLERVIGRETEFTVVLRKMNLARPRQLTLIHDFLSAADCKRKAEDFARMQRSVFSQMADIDVTPDEFQSAVPISGEALSERIRQHGTRPLEQDPIVSRYKEFLQSRGSK